MQRLASEEATWPENSPCFRTLLPEPTPNLLCGNVALPRGNVDLPSGNAALPGGNVALPHGNVTLPSGNVALPGGNVALPRGNMDLPWSIFNLPWGRLTLPLGRFILLETTHHRDRGGDRRRSRGPAGGKGRRSAGSGCHSPAESSPRACEDQEVSRAALPCRDQAGPGRSLQFLLRLRRRLPRGGGETEGRESERHVSIGSFPPGLPFVSG